MVIERKGDWTETYTGKRIWAMDPRKEEIFIEDIAHALSLICRFNGHSKFFYSVAQHSLLCSELALINGDDARFQMIMLLHDAAEAYISDVVRPVKKYLNGYAAIESNLQSVIFKAFNIAELAAHELVWFDFIDTKMLATEAPILMPFRGWGGLPFSPATDKVILDQIIEQRPADVEQRFLRRFHELAAKLKDLTA